jgi:SH3-like domain-containing protein
MRSYRLAVSLLALLGLLACSRTRQAAEVAYVSAPQAFLRDQVSTVYNKTGTVKNGEQVEVLGRDRRFVHVRTSAGVEGWIEQRYLVTDRIYDAFQKLAQQEQSSPVQATGTTRNQTNIHLDPDRESEHLYQLDQGAKVSIIKRATSEKVLPGGARSVPAKSGAPSSPAMEDWWLIRDSQGHTGWVLARLVDIDVPLEIAQYAEGQRIVACFPLHEVIDQDKKVPEYLVVLSENKDGMPFDFNAIRVFTWNVRRHRYETAYRERNLNGFFPVSVAHENFDKEGDLPVFIVRVKDDAGNVSERKYKLNSPIVKRVLAPGESAATPHESVSRSKKKKKR